MAPAVRNLAEQQPERLEQLKRLWFEYAEKYNGLPLDDRSAIEQLLAERPHTAAPRERYVYDPDCADVPEEGGVRINGRSYTIAAGVLIDEPEAQGVLYAHGGVVPDDLPPTRAVVGAPWWRQVEGADCHIPKARSPRTPNAPTIR